MSAARDIPKSISDRLYRKLSKESAESAVVWIGSAYWGQSLIENRRMLEDISDALAYWIKPDLGKRPVRPYNGLTFSNTWTASPDWLLDAPHRERNPVITRETETGILVIVPPRKDEAWFQAGAYAAALIALAVAIFGLYLPGGPNLSALKSELAKVKSEVLTLNQRVGTFEKQVADLQTLVKHLRTELEAALKEIAALKKELEWVKAELARVKRLVDIPELAPCWSQASKIAPIYIVEIGESNLTVSPSWTTDANPEWPTEHRDLMSKLPSGPIAPKTVLSPTEFSATMLPYYKLGVAQPTKCRFFVDIRDGATTKDAWKSGMSLIERYFYKLSVG